MISELERDYIRSILIKEDFTKQLGGGNETIEVGDKKLKYKIKNHIFEDGTIELLVTSLSKADNSLPCFRLSIIPGGEAVLNSLEKGRECFIDEHENSRDLVFAAYLISKKKGAKILKLTDNSAIYCPEKVYLSNLSFLTTGKTWYESILNIKPSEDINGELAKMRKRALENRWSDIENDLLRKGLILPFSKKGIDIDSIGSSMKVLSRAKKSKKFCSLFSENMSEILLSSNIINFKGKEWYLHID